jgi:3-hydroxyacyl-CoA dehydrogenase
MTNPHSDSKVADYLRHAAHQAWNVDGIADDLPRRNIERVGIIGAGTMGGGISMNFASVGIPVTLVETKQEALDRGLSTIRKNYQRSADRGRFPQEEVDICMNCYSPALDLSALADCDLIIEAVFEDMDIKKSVFSQLDKIAKPGAILATNTSALNIDEIAAVTSRPEDVIGLHFFSPANVMRLLEIVRAEHTRTMSWQPPST